MKEVIVVYLIAEIERQIITMPLTFFGASPSIVSTDRICRFPLLTVFLYDQRLLTLETWCGYE